MSTKVSRPVLRGPGPSNGARLLGEQMMLFADRTSTSWLRSNQIRLYFSTVAYLLMQAPVSYTHLTLPTILRV